METVNTNACVMEPIQRHGTDFHGDDHHASAGAEANLEGAESMRWAPASRQRPITIKTLLCRSCSRSTPTPSVSLCAIQEFEVQLEVRLVPNIGRVWIKIMKIL